MKVAVVSTYQVVQIYIYMGGQSTGTWAYFAYLCVYDIKSECQ